MSHILPILDCPNLQVDLLEVNNCKTYPQEDIPFTQFLTSDINTTRVLEQRVTPGGGKLRTVELVYTQRIGEAGVSTTLTTDCESSNEPGLLSTTYEIDPTQGVQVDREFIFSDFATMCKGNKQFVAETIQQMLDGATRKMETLLTQQSAALYGKFVATDDSGLSQSNTLKTIATLDANDKFTEDAIQEITFSTKNSGFCYTPFVFGYGAIWKYMQKTKAVCCAASGIDFAQFMAQNQAMFMSTYRVPAAMGVTDGFLVIDPGSLFLLQYNKFEADSGLDINSETLTMGIIVNPKTGVAFNYKATLVCGEKLHIYISTAFKVVGLPNDLYTANDRFYQTNGVLRFAVSNS